MLLGESLLRDRNIGRYANEISGARCGNRRLVTARGA
jgi:hypothetical protein